MRDFQIQTSDRSRPGAALNPFDPVNEEGSPRLVHSQARVRVVSMASTFHRLSFGCRESRLSPHCLVRTKRKSTGNFQVFCNC